MPDKIRDKWEFKSYLQRKRIYSYELADRLNITESALSVRIRRATPEQLKELAMIVDDLAKKRA